MGQTKEFFQTKKSWSHFKDKILDYYLVPYTQKIISSGMPLVIFDCFAGKGKFDDGINGSPLIVADRIRLCLQGRKNNISIRAVLIEKKYFEELKVTLAGYEDVVKILPGCFENNVQEILALNKKTAVFLYVDPYGIKSLHFNTFVQIGQKHFSSLELLMNFNSRGFIREGCRLLKYNDTFKDDDIEDYEADADVNTLDNMDVIAGGNYWREILADFYNKKIDIYQAENLFVQEYCKKLRQIFKYTVNIPIKVKTVHLPKYRLIFCSNHAQGLILMADNMHKKWKEIEDAERGGQELLFEHDVDLEPNMKESILSIVRSNSEGLHIEKVIACLIIKYNIAYSESDYIRVIKKMEDVELIVYRNPALTAKGKVSRAYDYTKREIILRAK